MNVPPLIAGRVSELLLRAQSLQEQGRQAPALEAYRAILELDPQHWESQRALAAAAIQGGSLQEAIRLYDAMISQDAAQAEPFYKRANAKNGLGLFAQAIDDYDRAIALSPEFAYAYCNRGTVLERLDRLDAALLSYDQAIALNPSDFLTYYNRASALKRLKRVDEALESYQEAIKLHPPYVEAHINRANLLQESRRFEEAIAGYDTSIALNSAYAEAFYGRGISLMGLDRFDEAIASFDKAIALKPEWSEAHHGRGIAHEGNKQYQLAVQDFGRALALDPRQPFLFGQKRHVQMYLHDWQGFASDLQQLTQKLADQHRACPPFAALTLLDAPRLHHIAARIWMQEKCPPDAALGPSLSRSVRDKIRIGYFSPDFRAHPVSMLAAELFESQDRSKFESFAFAFGPPADDPVRARLKRAFDQFIDVRNLSDLDVASKARKLGIDIAVDLSGFTEHSRPKIFSLRAAPIQISYLGYPGTMGAPYIDYLIGDRFVLPEQSDADYSEQLIYLPHSYLPNDSTRKIAETLWTRDRAALPATGFIYCCFNNSHKIAPQTFDSWMRILESTGNSVLWLSSSSSTAMVNLRAEAQRRGVDGKRLVFAERVPSWEEHLARLRVADLFLDTLPYGAHATAMDALWAGLPLLTLRGNSFAGRVASGLLHCVGMSELIASTAAEFEELAVTLGTNPGQLAEAKKKLALNRLTSPLFDSRLLMKHLEAAYTAVFQRHIGGLPPATFQVAETFNERGRL